MSIKKKLVTISYILLLTSVCVSLIANYIQKNKLITLTNNISTNLNEKDNENINQQIKSLSDNTVLFLTQLEDVVDMQMQNAALTLQKADMYSQITNEKMVGIAKETNMHELLITNITGDFIYATNPASIGANLFDIWDGYKMLLNGEASVLPSPIKIMIETGEIFKFTAIPRLDAQGNITGVIESAVSAKIIEQSLQQLMADNHVINSLFIFQNDGLLLTSNTSQPSKLIFEKGKVNDEETVLKVSKSGVAEIVEKEDGTLLSYIPVEKFGSVAYIILMEIDPTSYFANTKLTTASFNSITSNTQKDLLISMGIGMFFSIIIVSVYLILIERCLLKPIKDLSEIANNVALGAVDIQFKTIKEDEIGKLLSVFKTMVSGIKDQSIALEKISKGDFSVSVKERSSKDIIAQSLNAMVLTQKTYVEDISNTMDKISNGNLNSPITISYKGEFAPIKSSINNTIVNLNAMITEISQVLQEVSKGKLSHTIEKEFPGDFNLLKLYINEMILTQKGYITSISNVMGKLQDGDLSAIITSDYLGDFSNIKDSINNTMQSIKTYISEIINVLGAISKGDLTKEINVEFKGDFTQLKLSISEISNALNNTISQISNQALHVATGASDILTGSNILAEGAENQTLTIRDLLLLTTKIVNQVENNLQNTNFAVEASDKSLKEVLVGNEKMNLMILSMEEIRTASDEISKIIKTIRDIAFQTNLLALNAAVEASRAGVSGKGFAVVAEEVRNLANKSTQSAEVMSLLIENSVNAVEKGENIVKDTASSLTKIISITKETSEIVKSIGDATKEQAVSSNQINNGLEQISQVVQTNSATAQQSTCSSQQLAEQAIMLSQLVANFKVK